jgi:hypothetical protein
MSYVRMTVQAIELLLRRPVASNGVNQFSVTRQAGALHDLPTLFCDLDRLVKILECKIVGMPEAILDFCRPLADKLVRHVTVGATGDVMMSGFDPAVVLRVHDMTVGARLWIGREIGRAMRVIEREEADAGNNACQRTGKYDQSGIKRRTPKNPGTQ